MAGNISTQPKQGSQAMPMSSLSILLCLCTPPNVAKASMVVHAQSRCRQQFHLDFCEKLCQCKFSFITGFSYRFNPYLFISKLENFVSKSFTNEAENVCLKEIDGSKVFSSENDSRFFSFNGQLGKRQPCADVIKLFSM